MLSTNSIEAATNHSNLFLRAFKVLTIACGLLATVLGVSKISCSERCCAVKLIKFSAVSVALVLKISFSESVAPEKLNKDCAVL